MKKFGLIGGTSWRSTVEYYSAINEAINERHGDNTNPRLVIESLNQRRVHDLQCAGDWEAIADLFIESGQALERAGVEGVALCANTPHKIYDSLVAALDAPVLHIADAVAGRLKGNGWGRVGLIGTRFTMDEEFIKGRLGAVHGIETVVPDRSAQEEIQGLIYEKLSVGVFDEEGRGFLLGVIESLAREGAEAVILGCTEFPLLLEGGGCEVPLVDSLECHCEMIVGALSAG